MPRHCPRLSFVLAGLLFMFGCNRVFYYPNRTRYGSPDELNLRHEGVRFPTADGSVLHGYWLPAASGGPGSSLASADSPGVPQSSESSLLSTGVHRGPRNPESSLRSIGGHGGPPLQGVTEGLARPAVRGGAGAHGTVLHLHGNAGNVSGHFTHVAWLPAAGWNVLTFDYRGYGESQGRMSRTGSIADANAALDYLLSRPEVDPERVVAFGQSLGGAIGIVLTAQRPEIRGLATDGAFDSYRKIVAWHVRRNPLLMLAAWWYPLGISREWDPIDVVGRIAPRPVFIMHGMDDHVVDPAMARRLFDAAGEPKALWLVAGADHYGAMQDQAEEAQQRLDAFFVQCVER